MTGHQHEAIAIPQCQNLAFRKGRCETLMVWPVALHQSLLVEVCSRTCRRICITGHTSSIHQ